MNNDSVERGTHFGCDGDLHFARNAWFESGFHTISRGLIREESAFGFVSFFSAHSLAGACFAATRRPQLVRMWADVYSPCVIEIRLQRNTTHG